MKICYILLMLTIIIIIGLIMYINKLNDEIETLYNDYVNYKYIKSDSINIINKNINIIEKNIISLPPKYEIYSNNNNEFKWAINNNGKIYFSLVYDSYDKAVNSAWYYYNYIEIEKNQKWVKVVK